MSDETGSSLKVELTSGDLVSSTEVLVTMGRLEALLRKGLHGQLLLGELLAICGEETGRGDVADQAVQALIDQGLLGKSGRPTGDVRRIVRLAVKGRDGSELLTVQQPYVSTARNEDAMARAARRAVEVLGLGDLPPPAQRR